MAAMASTQDRRTGYDRRILRSKTDKQVSPGVYLYHGHSITKVESGEWYITEPATEYAFSAPSLKEAKKVVDERRKEARKALKQAEQRETKPVETPVEVKTTPTGKVRKPKQVKAEGGKVSEQTVAYIRDQMAPYFGPDPKRGKVKAYQDLALELNLGIETVARIARGDTYSDTR